MALCFIIEIYKNGSKDAMSAFKKVQGFSLIELMVVVAIVSVLAAVAMPAYEKYIQSAKISQSRVYVASILSNATDFYTTNGRFPQSMSELGLPGGSALTTPQPASTDDYLYKNLSVIEIENQGQQPRCASFYMKAYISDFSGGDFINGTGKVLLLIYQINDVDGTLVQNCQFLPPFSLDDPGGQEDLNYTVPSCINTATNMAEATEYSNYINANCM